MPCNDASLAARSCISAWLPLALPALGAPPANLQGLELPTAPVFPAGARPSRTLAGAAWRLGFGPIAVAHLAVPGIDPLTAYPIELWNYGLIIEKSTPATNQIFGNRPELQRPPLKIPNCCIAVRIAACYLLACARGGGELLRWHLI